MTAYVNQAIDAIQTAKRAALEALVPNAEMQKPFKTFIDAQTTFAKKYVEIVNGFINDTAMAPFSADYTKAFATKK